MNVAIGLLLLSSMKTLDDEFGWSSEAVKAQVSIGLLILMLVHIEAELNDMEVVMDGMPGVDKVV